MTLRTSHDIAPGTGERAGMNEDHYTTYVKLVGKRAVSRDEFAPLLDQRYREHVARCGTPGYRPTPLSRADHDAALLRYLGDAVKAKRMRPPTVDNLRQAYDIAAISRDEIRDVIQRRQQGGYSMGKAWRDLAAWVEEES